MKKNGKCREPAQLHHVRNDNRSEDI